MLCVAFGSPPGWAMPRPADPAANAAPTPNVHPTKSRRLVSGLPSIVLISSPPDRASARIASFDLRLDCFRLGGSHREPGSADCKPAGTRLLFRGIDHDVRARGP